MKRDKYVGMAVGGPEAGCLIDARSPRFRVCVSHPLPEATQKASEALEAEPVRSFAYRYVEFANSGLFVPDDWEWDQIARELVSNYRILRKG